MATKARAYRASSSEDSPSSDGYVLTRRRIAAVLAQLGGWYTTWRFINALGIGDLAGLGISVGVEWSLFEFKQVVLNGTEKGNIYGWVAIIIDMLLNAGGLWAIVLNLDNTDSYKMLVTTLQIGGSEMRLIPALVVALGLGLLLAIAPHQLWHGRKD